jgi:aryl-alcohol dehydrogenase-like predicted oxidoreductase
MPARYDLNDPANATKLAAVDQLTELAAKAGYSLPELAVAFVLEHPAVTSAIIGPRTMEQLTSLLKSYEIRLDGGILDRIDEIVPPGTNLNQSDRGYEPPALTTPSLRRRAR